MPAMTALGWFHTVMGIIALSSGAYALYQYKEIVPGNRSGLIYLAATQCGHCRHARDPC